jgi:3-hydroxybutyryl-CoA dehydrogenase
MEIQLKKTDPVLVIGNSSLMAGVAICLLEAGHNVDVCSRQEEAFSRLFDLHVNAYVKVKAQTIDFERLNICNTIPTNNTYKLVVVLTNESLETKRQLIRKLEGLVTRDAVIAINTESIPLNLLCDKSSVPDRLLGLNWTEPAHTTFFLEIISGENKALGEKICDLAKSHWGKDPYIVDNNGIRSRLISAMVREASFLIDNDYASVDDIDRACRNDAGYYLPFSGNCRYMDLMGTYAYGMVMKDLNPDLSKSAQFPAFFKEILDDGGLGMENGKGFYTYSEAEVISWKKTMEKFSYQIQTIIKKYPFNYKKGKATD